MNQLDYGVLCESIVQRKRLNFSLLLLMLLGILLSAPLQAQPGKTTTPNSPAIILPILERPTVQERFAPRIQSLNLWAGGIAHIRDDYYTSYGAKGDVSYFFNDTLGITLGVRHLWTSLSDEAIILRDRYGLTPDARPQSWNYGIGMLFGMGYAKALFANSITHIDPILGVHFGMTSADERWLPTLEFSALPTVLLAYGLKVRFELVTTVQFEQRERGTVITTGFLPSITLGWGGTFKELSTRFGFEKKASTKPPQALQPTPKTSP